MNKAVKYQEKTKLRTKIFINIALNLKGGPTLAPS